MPFIRLSCIRGIALNRGSLGSSNVHTKVQTCVSLNMHISPDAHVILDVRVIPDVHVILDLHVQN